MPRISGRCHFWSIEMLEYPKMLYIGSKQSYKHESALNSEHEAELRELGFVDFSDLEDHVENLSVDSASGKEFDKSYVSIEKYQELEEELADLKGTHFAFLNDVQAMKSRIAEIQGNKDHIGTANDSIDYNSMTSDQIRKILDEKGIKYLVRDGKDTLIALLSQSVKSEE